MVQVMIRIGRAKYHTKQNLALRVQRTQEVGTRVWDSSYVGCYF